MIIELKSDILEITNIKKKTQATMLKDCVVGDKIQLSIDASPVGGNRGTYASYITVKRLRDGKTRSYSFNQINVLYRAFDLRIVE